LQAYKSDTEHERLWLPFKDVTSGKESYGAGRYLDLEPDRHLMSDGRWIVDFNEAYNPWCAYSQNYVCPFVPSENRLNVPIRAGEKRYVRTLPQDHALMACSNYESDGFGDDLPNNAHHAGEVSFLRSLARPGMHVVEVGANTGVTAVALAKEIGDTGRLYAFEPVPEYYATLMDNLSRNGVKNVSAYRLALSNQVGRIRFYKREEGSGITPAEGGEALWVEATTVTEFLALQGISRVDLLNLDCEGSELLVLKGAEPVLEKQVPQIFCEIHHAYLDELGQSVDDVVDFLRQFGYDVQLLQVEDLEAETSVATCSHIYATASRPRAQR